MSPVTWCNRIIRWSFYLLFVLVPLILTPVNYELFEYNKMMVTYALTVVIVAAWVSKILIKREINLARSVLDIPLGLFFLAQLVSTIFSIDPHVSWLGYYSRFNGGLWSIISYLALYYAFVSNFAQILPIVKTKKTLPGADGSANLDSLFGTLLRVILAVASAIALYGVAERLGVDKNLWVQDVQNRVFSTLGQPNWLGAYLAALLPLALAFWLLTTPKISGLKSLLSLRGIYYALLVILFFLVLLFTRSRSGLFGLLVADMIFWFGYYRVKPDKKSWKLPALAAHLVFLLLIFFNGSNFAQIDKYFSFAAWKGLLSKPKTAAAPATPAYKAPLLEAGGTESGTIRKYVWQAAVNTWRSSTKTFLIGTGTETFAFAFYRYKPAAHNLTSEWDYLYNKAHNEYLNYLATTGILGLGSYLSIILVFIFWFMKHFKAEGRDLLKLALFAGWVSLLVTNFFGFSVVVGQLLFFLFPAIILVAAKDSGVVVNYFPLPANTPNRVTVGAKLITLGLGLFFLTTLVRHWYADKNYATGYRFARASQYVAAQSWLARAISLNPREPLYHDEMSTTLGALTAVAIDNKNATAGAALARQALAESDTAITISPQNVNFWKSRTKIFYSFSAFDPQFTPAAIETLERALLLSPTDPKIVYNLAILNGRQNDNNKAIEMLQMAIKLKPNYRDAYLALYIFYTEVKQPQLARTTLSEYLTKVDPNDKEFQDRLR